MSNTMFSIARVIKKIYSFEMKINLINNVLNDVVKIYLKRSDSEDVLHFRSRINNYYSDIKYIKKELLIKYGTNDMVLNSNCNLINDEKYNLERIDRNVDKLTKEFQVYLINKI